MGARGFFLRVERLITGANKIAIVIPHNPGADFLRGLYSNNRSFGVSDEKTIRNALLALYTNKCVEAFYDSLLFLLVRCFDFRPRMQR